MIAHLEDRAAALMAGGWTRREAAWLALVCLHSGVFLRSQYLAFIGRTNPALAHRFMRRCRKYAVEQPWNGSRLRVCRIASPRIYQVLGVEHSRHRRPAAPEVVVRRLLSLDYLLERPHTSWLATETGKVDALTAAGIARDVLPRRLYQGAVGVQHGYFPQDAGRARRLAGDVRLCPGRGRDAERGPDMGLAACRAVGGARRGGPPRRGGRRAPGPGASGRHGASARQVGGAPPESVTMSHQEAAAEMAAIKAAIATSDLAALEAWGGLNPALQRTRVLNAASAGSRRSTTAITVGRAWRSTRVPSDLPRP